MWLINQKAWNYDVKMVCQMMINQEAWNEEVKIVCQNKFEIK